MTGTGFQDLSGLGIKSMYLHRVCVLHGHCKLWYLIRMCPKKRGILMWIVENYDKKVVMSDLRRCLFLCWDLYWSSVSWCSQLVNVQFYLQSHWTRHCNDHFGCFISLSFLHSFFIVILLAWFNLLWWFWCRFECLKNINTHIEAFFKSHTCLIRTGVGCRWVVGLIPCADFRHLLIWFQLIAHPREAYKSITG